LARRIWKKPSAGFSIKTILVYFFSHIFSNAVSHIEFNGTAAGILQNADRTPHISDQMYNKEVLFIFRRR
jgi:hypothetical protein